MSGRTLMVVMALFLSLVLGIAIAVGFAGPNALAPWPITVAHSGGALTAIPPGASAAFSPSPTPTRAPTGVFSPRSTSTARLQATPSSTSTPTPTTVALTPTGGAASPTMILAAPASPTPTPTTGALTPTEGAAPPTMTLASPASPTPTPTTGALTPTEGAASPTMTLVAPAPCATIDFEVLQAYTKMADEGLGPAEWAWRVRNRATNVECMWGGRGQETDSLYAREITGQVTETQKAKLTWVGGNEYELALAAPPGLQYALVWRLVVPATGEVGGPELVAPREAVALTPTPTPTIIPTPTPTATATPTPCPTEVYECRCQDRCQTDSITGRTICRRVCDHCTRSACP